MKSRSYAQEILRNTVSNYSAQIVQIGVFFFLTPLIASGLGTELFGLWALIQSVLVLLGLFDLGFGVSVVKFIADAKGKRDPSRLKNLTATFFWVYVLLGASLFLFALLISPFLPEVLSIPGPYVRTAKKVFLIVALRSAIGMPLGMFSGVFIGFQKQWLANIFLIANHLFYGLSAFFVIKLHPSIENLALASLLSYAAVMSASALLCVKFVQDLSIKPLDARFSMIGEISSFSLYSFMIHVSGLIYTRVDTLIIQSFLSLSSVALYTVSARVSEQASGPTKQLTRALTPTIAELYGRGNHEKIKEVFRFGTKLSTAMAIPLLAGLALLSEPLLTMWMGEAFKDATLAMQILLIARISSVIHGNAANILSMTGHQRYLALSFLFGQLLNISMTLMLITTLGLAGVALATLIATLIVDILFVQRKASKTTGLKIFPFYFYTVGPSLLPLLIMLSLLTLGTWLFPPYSLFAVLLHFSTGCLLFLISFIFFGLTKKERSYLKNRIVVALLPSK